MTPYRRTFRPLAIALLAASMALALAPTHAADAKKPAAPPTATPAPVPATTATGAPRSDYRFAVKEFGVAQSIVYPGWNGYQTGLNNAVCDMLTTEMSKQGRDMVERQRIEDVIGEQDLGAAGRLDKSTVAPIGKIVGADYLILGTITEWGMKDRSIGGGGLFGGVLGAAQYHDTTARVKIDYHVVNAKTGRIVSGSAGTAMGEDSNRGVGLQKNWWNSINFSESEWADSQIGKATRKCVQQIAQQLSVWTPSDGGAEPDRPALSANVVAIISPEEFVIDKGKSDDVRVGDTLEVVSRTAIKNSTGKVVYQKESSAGTGVVTDVQQDGASVRLTHPLTAPLKLKEGDGVHTPAPTTSPAH